MASLRSLEILQHGTAHRHFTIYYGIRSHNTSNDLFVCLQVYARALCFSARNIEMYMLPGVLQQENNICLNFSICEWIGEHLI